MRFIFLPNANVNKNGQKKQQDIVRCKPNEREWKKFFLELFIFIIHALIQSQVDLRGCKKLLSSVVLFFVVVYLIKFLVGKINNVENEKWSLFASTMAQMLIATLNNSERTRIYINYVNNLFVCKENKINQMMRWIIANARKKKRKNCASGFMMMVKFFGLVWNRSKTIYYFIQMRYLRMTSNTFCRLYAPAKRFILCLVNKDIAILSFFRGQFYFEIICHLFYLTIPCAHLLQLML